MKNKNVIIGIAVIIIIILLGIIIKQSKDITEIKKSIGMKDVEEINTDNKSIDKSKSISKEEFTKYIQKVELTTDNWKNYFEIEEKTTEDKNEWGEVTETRINKYLQLKQPYYETGELIDTIMDIEIDKSKLDEFYYNKNKKTVVFQYTEGEKSNGNKRAIESLYGWDNITMEDMKCTRIKGTLYYLKDFAESNWQTDSKGKKFVNIGDIIYYKNTFDYGKTSNMSLLKDLVEN